MSWYNEYWVWVLIIGIIVTVVGIIIAIIYASNNSRSVPTWTWWIIIIGLVILVISIIWALFSGRSSEECCVNIPPMETITTPQITNQPQMMSYAMVPIVNSNNQSIDPGFTVTQSNKQQTSTTPIEETRALSFNVTATPVTKVPTSTSSGLSQLGSINYSSS